MRLATWRVASGIAPGVLNLASSGSGGSMGMGEYTCDGVTVNKVDCEEAAKKGASDYCRSRADTLVNRKGFAKYSIFKMMQYLQCQEACMTAWADCLTIELERAPEPQS